MTNKFIKQYNYAEMSVLNVKSIKVTNGENKDNIPLQVSPKEGGGMIHFVNSRVARDTVWELEGSMRYSQGTGGEHVMQSGNWRVTRDSVWELEGCT